MKDRDQSVTWRPGMGDELPEHLWAYDDSAEADDRPSVDPVTGLVSIGFLGAALRRRARLWCALAVIGLVVGAGWVVKSPPAYKASASVLVVDDPTQDPATEVLTDVALAQSTAVAQGVISQLRLQQTPSQFLGTYTVANVSDQVLTMTVSAPTSAEAVQRASALATQYLKFRAQYLQTQLQQSQVGLQQQVTQAQQSLNSVNSQIKQVSAQPSTPGTRAELKRLQAQSVDATNNLDSVQGYASTTLSTAKSTTRTMVKGSVVLNAVAPAKHSTLKTLALYAFGGLFGGLVLGMIIVIIAAVTSDRLRRRDDIAQTMGAPVRLSVGPLRESRWMPDLRGRGLIRHRDMERVVQHLRNAVPGSSRGPAGLAVVAVDDPATVARAVMAVAVSFARERRRVVLADLSAGADAARLLHAKGPGISTVSTDDVSVVVVVPDPKDIAPVGPLQSHASPEGYAQADESLVATCSGADLVLSLATLDPALGGEHLSTWATDAVAVVTAGVSTAGRIQAAGDMVRLAGTRLGSVVVIDADKRDETLGAASTEYQPVPG